MSDKFITLKLENFEDMQEFIDSGLEESVVKLGYEYPQGCVNFVEFSSCCDLDVEYAPMMEDFHLSGDYTTTVMIYDGIYQTGIVHRRTDGLVEKYCEKKKHFLPASAIIPRDDKHNDIVMLWKGKGIKPESRV